MAGKAKANKVPVEMPEPVITEDQEITGEPVEPEIKKDTVIDPCAACGVAKGSRLCKTCIENKG